MKKKALRRLTLNRETLRNLQPGALGNVAGGAQCTIEDMTTCVCTDANCQSGGTGTGTWGCPPTTTGGINCPTNTMLDWTCCDC